MTITPIGSERSPRRNTSTPNFGSGRREGHDATAFYARFVSPEISSETTIERPPELDVIYKQDARFMTKIPSNSVALVVTSPPYFAGKQYEESLGENGVPATYFEYLDLLHDVFAECKRVMEPGGRIAVNVANLGRRPYRSLSADVTGILQDLGLLLRGEVIWWKGRAAGGSCAWGSFQRPANPVLRDITERVVVASKGRFDRALTPRQREMKGLPSTATISRDEFIEATTDLWEIAPESATRVGHPAPFPVELPKRFIELYTYEGDVVLDPFMGSGSAAIAAVQTNRHFLGFDTDAGYIRAAKKRIAAERLRLKHDGSAGAFKVVLPASEAVNVDDGPRANAIRQGRQARDVARLLLEESGFVNIREHVKPRGTGVAIDFVAADATGNEWAFDVSGAFTTNRAGLRRSDTLWKALGLAGVLHASGAAPRLILLTTDAPTKGTPGFKAMNAMRGADNAIFDVIELLTEADQQRLREIAAGGATGP